MNSLSSNKKKRRVRHAMFIMLFFSSVVWKSGDYEVVEWSLAEWRICNLHAVHVD